MLATWHVAVCPGIEATDMFSVDAGANLIVRIEISGAFVCFDDLTWFFFG